MALAPLRKRARQFTRMVRASALCPRTGRTHKPVLARKEDMAVTFIGHSAFFIQCGGQNLVVDPNFARWLFLLKRLRQPGLRVADLPPIDVVLVTHAHFDHLHRPSLRAIARHTKRQRGTPPAIVVPRDVRDLVRRLGYREIIELDWWQTHRRDTLSITHVPAQHWGARILADMHRGYGGYVVRNGRHSFYHAGDTGYFDGFREIGKRLKPELALLPIGAYYPPHFQTVHTSPADAVRAFRDLGARWMVPMHYGSFRLTYEPLNEPLEWLSREAQQSGLTERVVVLEEGVTRFF
jgi:L-ascorbate metabolism protein UlaG (beta-lactamase superfamily)